MSLVEVARAAGVSVATASRVLSNSDHPISAETRKRVLRAAAALGYYPSAVARALVTQQTNIVGVIVGDIDDPYFSTIVRGIQDTAREHGYLTVVCNSDRNPEIELDYVRTLRDYRVDGLIFAGGGLDDKDYLTRLEPLLSAMKERGARIVGIGQHRFSSARVDIDNSGATQKMTEYLLGLGHREIAYIKGPVGLTTSSSRFEAHYLTLQRHAGSLNPELVVQGDFTFESGFEGTTYLFESGHIPTAIFAANDQMAIGALVAVQRRGLQVPQEISVVGFDDIAAARYVYPPLTTIRVPMYELGVTAMKELIELLNNEKEDGQQVLNHELLVRGSSGPPPQARGEMEEKSS